ncbi:O-antigen ligase like membrane protein [Alicyclobacillus hesperidum]|uniref:O-antigen ligase like membrane protein n=1 Tax=Alicyclobacillus hesperidum TaxID=89784 RepID=A0A1H2QT12_9BACL|nr:O-antigen ligase family protein [Alicyclobacillus hesperidum]SDW10020.1 O-antigen ligase like membrane protein [Alicyclobacillus hesperidum]
MVQTSVPTAEDHSSSAQSNYGDALARWCVYTLGAFAIVNQGLDISVLSGLGNLWGTIAIACLAVIALVRVAYGLRRQGFRWSRYAGWYILYCATLILYGLKHPLLAFNGFSVDVEYIVIALLLPWVVESRDVPRLLYGVIAVSMLLGVDGVFQYAIKVPIPDTWLDVGEVVRTRVFSVMKSPAELGANLEMTIPMMFGLFAVDRHPARRFVYIAGGMCSLAALFFTYDRGSWLGLGAAVLIVAVVYERRVLPILLVLGVIAFFIPSIHMRVMDLFNPVYAVKSSAGGRMLLWQQAFDTMAKNPLFGAGLGQYGGYVATSHSLSSFSDNYYAKVLGETGLVGLVLFMAMHVAILREIATSVVRRAKGRNRWLALAGLTSVLAILIHSFVENLFEYNYTASLYFVIVGLILLWGRTLPESSAEMPGRKRGTLK